MKEVDYSYADRYCRCGTYLGNYMTGNFYSLIRKKYCDVCKPIVVNEQKRFSKKSLHKSRKPLCDALLERAILVEAENKLLRQKNKLLKAEVERLYE